LQGHEKHGVILRETEEVREKKKTFLHSELASLGIDCKRRNELNDIGELEFLTIAIKEVHYQDYKTAYQQSKEQEIGKIEIDKSYFEYLI
jgi:hypothetical protein